MPYGCTLNSTARHVTVTVLVLMAFVSVRVKASTPLFLSTVTYDSGGYAAESIAIGDLNGDGAPDVAVANCGSNNVGVLLGNGDGTLRSSVTFDSGGRCPDSVVVADINRDAKTDLLVTNFCESATNCIKGTIGVLLGNGDGTFNTATIFDSGGNSTVSIAIADVNGDGKLDVLTANQGGQVGVLIGNGDGGFDVPVTYSSGGNANSVSVADLNADHRVDVVVVNFGSGPVGVLLGNGDGTFQPAVAYDSGGENPWSAAIADVNGDRRPDLLVANRYSFNVGVLLGNGDGTFQAATTFGSGGSYDESVTAGDVNGDGRPDLLVTNESFTVGVLLGKGGGLFETATVFASGGFAATSVVAADLNGDARPDLIVANACDDGACRGHGAVGALLNSSVGPIPARIDIKPRQFPNRVNPNSHALLRVALLATDTFDLTMVDPGSVRFGPAGARPVGVRETDVDGDGRPDAVYYFKTNKTGIACGDMSASLVGVIDDGQTFMGTDSIRTQGCQHAEAWRH